MSKGAKNEKRLHDTYHAAGWLPYKPATVRFGENDMWGHFDILAVKPAAGRVHAVQAKTNQTSGVERWGRVTRPWRLCGMRTLYAVHMDGEGWRVYDPALPPEDARRPCKLVLDEPNSDRVSGNRGGELNTGGLLEEWLRGDV